MDKYDAIRHDHTENPGAQEQTAATGTEKKGRCVRRIHVISNILQDEMLEPSNECDRASRERRRKKKRKYTDSFD